MQLRDVMAALAPRRPFFHSERDFQHALAWEIQLRHPDAVLRLEPRPRPGIHLDLLVRMPQRRIAIEIKYLVAGITTTVHGEEFVLPNQGAHDISRYDVIKDVVRLERLVTDGYADEGIGVTLTNDPAYWRPGYKADPIDAAFRIHEGRPVRGSLGWSAAAGPGTTKGREQPLNLVGRYRCDWQRYSTVVRHTGQHCELRYLVFEVNAPAASGPDFDGPAISGLHEPIPHAPAAEPSPRDDHLPQVGAAATAREQILDAVTAILRRSAASEFTLNDVLAELRRRGSRLAESTIRTHVTSRMCANAPDHHATTFDDFERLDRGRYRLRPPSHP